MSTLSLTETMPFVDQHALARWNRQTIRLRYSLSYLKLFELKFNALRNPEPFDPERPAIACPRPPADRIPDDYDAVVEHELLVQEIPIIQNLPNLLCYAPRQMPHYYTDLRGGERAAFTCMTAKTRSAISRKVRLYREFSGGEIRWKMYRTPEEMSTFHGLARTLSKKTYQERLFDSGIPDSEVFRTEMLELAQRDSVRGFILFKETAPVAYLYTPAPDGFLVYEYLGYDPEYASRSPGTVLQYLALQALYAEGRFAMYYWGYGHSQTKQVFSTGQVLGADIYYFRPTLRNRLAVHSHLAMDRLSTRAGVAMDRMQVKQTVKKWLKKQ